MTTACTKEVNDVIHQNCASCALRLAAVVEQALTERLCLELRHVGANHLYTREASQGADAGLPCRHAERGQVNERDI